MSNRTLDTSGAISYGWNSVKKDFWYLVGIAVVSTVINGLGSSDAKKMNIWDYLSPFLSAWMTCGYTKMMLDYQSGNKLPFPELFTQFKYYWRVLLATLLLGLIVGVGFIFLIVPGIYLALKYQFTIYLIIDKNLGIMEAMNESSKMTDGVKMSLFMFGLMLIGVMLLGVICLGVGAFVAMPVAWLATVVVYRRLAGAPQPVTPTPVQAQ
jgi:uncharacterized membrane protein